MERIERMLEETPDHVSGRVVGTHIILNIVGEEVHYWSPQLNFRVEADEYEPGQTIIAGLIGPRPQVWTMFMFIYFSVGAGGLALTTYGASKWMLGEYSPTVMGFPIAILFMLTAYKAGKYGESLGKDQITLLKDFVRKAITIDEG